MIGEYPVNKICEIPGCNSEAIEHAGKNKFLCVAHTERRAKLRKGYALEKNDLEEESRKRIQELFEQYLARIANFYAGELSDEN
mgnify:FL=1